MIANREIRQFIARCDAPVKQQCLLLLRLVWLMCALAASLGNVCCERRRKKSSELLVVARVRFGLQQNKKENWSNAFDDLRSSFEQRQQLQQQPLMQQ